DCVPAAEGCRMNSIERLFPWLVVALGALYLLPAITPHEPASQLQLQEFGKIPVVANGRVKPMDTFARTSLMVVSSGHQTFKDEAGYEQPAIKWLLEAMTSRIDSEHRAWKYKVFRIEDLQVLNLLGLEHRPMFWRYAIDEFADKIELIAREATRASKLD